MIFSKKHKANEHAERMMAADLANTKRKIHQATTQVNKDTRSLSDLLKANGITFKIHIAAGGKHD